MPRLLPVERGSRNYLELSYPTILHCAQKKQKHGEHDVHPPSSSSILVERVLDAGGALDDGARRRRPRASGRRSAAVPIVRGSIRYFGCVLVVALLAPTPSDDDFPPGESRSRRRRPAASMVRVDDLPSHARLPRRLRRTDYDDVGIGPTFALQRADEGDTVGEGGGIRHIGRRRDVVLRTGGSGARGGRGLSRVVREGRRRRRVAASASSSAPPAGVEGADVVVAIVVVVVGVARCAVAIIVDFIARRAVAIDVVVPGSRSLLLVTEVAEIVVLRAVVHGFAISGLSRYG